MLAITAALVAPALSVAHGPADGTEHRAADLVGVPMPTLERRARAVARRLGRRPGARPRASASAVVDPGVGGRWSDVLPAPVVPVFAALLPDGKVLVWDSIGDEPTESYPDSEHTTTRAAVYDPATNTHRRVDVPGANLFCAGFVQLANGDIFVAGGNENQRLDGLRRTHVFHWRTETWSRGPDLRDGRWYPSVAAMPNDEAVIVGGGPTVAEVRTSTGEIRPLPGVETPSSRRYPFMQAAPDGRALLLGDDPRMSLIDVFGAGSILPAGTRDEVSRAYGGYAPYDVGRFLVAGGGPSGVAPSASATTVDARSGTPVATGTSPMAFRRRQANTTLLADGSVLATGGQRTWSDGGNIDLDPGNAVFAAERWDPATGAWTALNEAGRIRQYHSTALLLPDGRVLTGGGGICDVCDARGYLEKNFEVFTPPYLYRRDGSGALAARPSLASVPAQIAFDTPFIVTSPDAPRIRKLALVRLGAPTHGMDQGQRYVPVGFTVTGTTLTVDGPANPNEAPAGHYMLFAVDAAGVPSVAKVVQVRRTLASAPTAVPLVAYAERDTTGRAQRFEVGRYDAARGNLGQVGDDAIRSLDVAAGYAATVCRGGELADCATLPAGRHDTMPAGFDRTVSSLRVTAGPVSATPPTVPDPPPAGGPPGSAATPTPPRASPRTPRFSLTAPWSRRRTAAVTALTGRLSDAPQRLRVRIAVGRRVKGSRTRCAWWSRRRGRFSGPGRCARPTTFSATVRRSGSGWRWSARLGGRLRRGAYVVALRAVGPTGRTVSATRYEVGRYPPAASARRRPLTAQMANTTSSPAPIP